MGQSKKKASVEPGKKKRTRIIRTTKQKIQDLENMLAKERAKDALNSLEAAVKAKPIDSDNVKECRRLLRHVKIIEKALRVFKDHDLDIEVVIVVDLRDKLLEKLREFVKSDHDEDSDNDEKRKATKKKATKKKTTKKKAAKRKSTKKRIL